MGKTLVITEKPSVAREIAGVLGQTNKGDGWIEAGDVTLTWAVGHLLQLADPETYREEWKRWRFDDLPILPDHFDITPRDAGARKQLGIIKKLSKGDFDRVVNACDAGREGELIFAWVRDHCRIKTPIERLWLSSLTKSAIKDAWNDRRPASEYKRLESAARSRAEADWLVGLNATRAASLQLRGAFAGRQVLSLGRVQTPTLAIIVRREAEINAFVPETFWTLDARFTAANGEYWGRLFADGGDRHPQSLVERAQSETFGRQGAITKLDKKEVSEPPPFLFDLTSLQREANNKFGFTAKRTLQAAQALYEKHAMLTYPRTDSRYLSTDVGQTIPELLGKLGAYEPVNAFVEIEPRFDRAINDKKVSDHHAIIPTGVVKPLDGDDAKIFDLVTRRFVANVSPNAQIERTTLTTRVGEWDFRSKGRIILSAGWRALYGGEATDPNDEMPNQALPKLESGETVSLAEHTARERQTKPPSRYSDASLLGAMETAGKTVEDEALKEILKESGLGTPATRAAIIETLISREYISRSGKQLVPTEKGVRLIDLLGEHLLTSAEMTGEWEKSLNGIAGGTATPEAFQSAIRQFTRSTVEQFGKMSVADVPRAELGPCPICSKPVRENRKGYSCWSREDPGCGMAIWKELAGRTITADEAKQLLEHRITEPIPGWKAGRDEFTSRAQLAQENDKWTVTLPDAPATARIGSREAVADCPECGRSVWENRKGFSCWTRKDPGCGLVIWKQHGKLLLDADHAAQLLTTKRTELESTIVELRKDADGWQIVIDGTAKPAGASKRGDGDEKPTKKRAAKKKAAAKKRPAEKRPAEQVAEPEINRTDEPDFDPSEYEAYAE